MFNPSRQRKYKGSKQRISLYLGPSGTTSTLAISIRPLVWARSYQFSAILCFIEKTYNSTFSIKGESMGIGSKKTISIRK